MAGSYDIAAYIWPAYTGDEPRSEIFWPEGIGEWQTVKCASSKFPGHQWPRKPRWGYVNEADPRVMEMQIDAAADYGVNVFIYDWYWYDGRPFLENCLDNGYLKARNNSRVKFYLMWANHDANRTWDLRLSDKPDNVIWKGSVARAEFERIGRRLVDNYFTLPNYYKIDGKPVFMIYDLANLLNGLGGVEKVNDALKWLRDEAVKAGLPGLHLQVTLRGGAKINLSGVDGADGVSTERALELADFDSCTHYQFVHFVNIDRDYSVAMQDVLKEWRHLDKVCPKPYFPHVSVGWDNNPRFKSFRQGIMKGNTPEAFEKALQAAKEFLDAKPGMPRLITVNSWNEWTESSYLEPDDLNGYGYLEAVAKVFPDRAR